MLTQPLGHLVEIPYYRGVLKYQVRDEFARELDSVFVGVDMPHTNRLWSPPRGEKSPQHRVSWGLRRRG